MKAADLREKGTSGLTEELLALRKEQFNLRMQKASGQLENTAQLRSVRRNIARVKTVLAQVASKGDQA